MKPEEIVKYYGTRYKFAKKTGMSASSLLNWLNWGYVPEASQYKLERLTKGELKMQLIDNEKILQEIDKYIDQIWLNLDLCKMHMYKGRIDLSYKYLLDAKAGLEDLERGYP